MNNELSANEVVKIVQELKALERKFAGKDGLLNYLHHIRESLNSQYQSIDNSKKEFESLFEKLQDSKNIKIEVEKLKLELVNKEEFEELVKLVNYIRNFKTFLAQKTNEINNAYNKLNRLWFEENEVLQRIEKIEKNLLSKVLFGGIGIGLFLSHLTLIVYVYFK